MTKYIPPVHKIKFKFPRKKKKKAIKEMGREFYHKLVTEDSWLPNSFMTNMFPDWYEREMRERKYELREKKLERIS